MKCSDRRAWPQNVAIWEYRTTCGGPFVARKGLMERRSLAVGAAWTMLEMHDIHESRREHHGVEFDPG